MGTSVMFVVALCVINGDSPKRIPRGRRGRRSGALLHW